jgi:hypothetical protein
MSGSPDNGGGPPDDRGGGPPAHAGIPDGVRQKLKHTKRKQDGTIEVSGSSLEDLSAQIDWNNLTPFQEYIIAVLEELGLLDELVREIYDGDGENPFEG